MLEYLFELEKFCSKTTNIWEFILIQKLCAEWETHFVTLLGDFPLVVCGNFQLETCNFIILEVLTGEVFLESKNKS